MPYETTRTHSTLTPPHAARTQVDVEDAKDFAEDNNLAFIETSAYDATNVELAFETVTQASERTLPASA